MKVSSGLKIVSLLLVIAVVSFIAGWFVMMGYVS
ncbi:hypothetical protein BH23ACT11_BH23ACT11_15250 [soil metagenome]